MEPEPTRRGARTAIRPARHPGKRSAPSTGDGADVNRTPQRRATPSARAAAATAAVTAGATRSSNGDGMT